jgi:hypothetical protein
VNAPFSVVIQSLDNSDVPAAVTQNTGISLSLATGNGTLGGTLTGTILSGQNSVTISGVTYDVAETGVSITATRTSGDVLASGTSSLFTVLGAADHLTFVGVPSSGSPNTALPQFTVEGRRADNTVDLAFTGTITLAKASGPGVVSGTLSKAAVAGVATFNDIQMDAVGSYTLSASSAPLTGTTSSSIDIASNGLPMVEEFIYTPGTTLVSNGWTAHSAAGTNSISVTTPSLTYAGYSTGLGNAASMTNTGEDVNRQFAPVTSDSLYASFLVNVSAAGSGDYFFHLIQGSPGSGAFFARVFVRLATNGNLAFGVSKTTIGGMSGVIASLSDSVFTLSTTYVVIVKYNFKTGTASDDEVSLFVVSSTYPLAEPVTPTVGPVTTSQNDATGLTYMALRQGGGNGVAPTLVIDAIRIATDWPDSPLPIQLASFTGAAISNNAVRLDWATLSEVNNFGFYIQRRNASEQTFAELPNSFVPGHGTTLIPQYYTFTDNTAGVGRWFYRLKQVDLDGTITLTDPIQVDVLTGVGESAPKEFALNQNYPNPFNPSTEIKFSVEQNGLARLRVYNLLGQEVGTLFNGMAEAGRYYNVKLDASNLPSGMYFYKLESGQKNDLKKMLLLK